MHQAIGTTVETKGNRGVGKMKAVSAFTAEEVDAERDQVITQRFVLPSADGTGTVEVDVECQNRFVNFLEKTNGEWKIHCKRCVPLIRQSSDSFRLQGLL
jgi:hypothetical protein